MKLPSIIEPTSDISKQGRMMRNSRSNEELQTDDPCGEGGGDIEDKKPMLTKDVGIVPLPNAGHRQQWVLRG